MLCSYVLGLSDIECMICLVFRRNNNNNNNNSNNNNNNINVYCIKRPN